MKILQICHRTPFPPVDGGNIVMMNTALGLIEAGNEVFQFALNTKKHFVNPDSIPEKILEKLHFQSVDIDTGIRLNELVKNLFTNESYNIIRFHDDSVVKSLEHLLREHSFDVVQLETLFTASYISCIRKNSSAKIVLRAHNVEHLIWERLAKKESNIVKKNYLKLLARRLKNFELKVLREVDALIPITHVDEANFRELHFTRPMITIPMCLDIKDYPFDENHRAEMCLFHLGSMDWLPNVEAINWFLKNCWMKIHSHFPTLKLYLAGRGFPPAIAALNYPNVLCEGMIEDANQYMSEKQIMIVPLHSGSGMRVKIIEGLALGKTILSTTIGAEGIPVKHEENILIANSPDEYFALVKRCIENPEWCRRIGLNGRKYVEKHFSNIETGRQLTVFYKALTKLG